MKCNRVLKLLPDYIGDELTAKERKRIDQHIEECLNCRNALNILMKSWDEFAHQPLPQKGEEFWQKFTLDVMRGIRAERPMASERKRPFIIPGYRFLLPTAALCLIIVGIIILKGGLWEPFKWERQTPWASFDEQAALVEVVHSLSFAPLATEEGGPLGRGIVLNELPLLAEVLRIPLKPTETETIAEVLTQLFGEEDLYGKLERLKGEELEEFHQLLSSKYPYS